MQRQKTDSLTIFEKIVIDGHESRIPFYFFVNKRKENPPCVILMHGLTDSKEDWVYPSEPYLEWSRNTTAIKDSLLALGYQVLIPDAMFHGERSYELDFRSPGSLPPSISRNEKDSKLFEHMMTSTVKDLRILMDYIQGRDTHPSRSFSIIGYSMGGNLGILLGVFDPRITSIVACVPGVNLPEKELEGFAWSEEVVRGQTDITPMTHARSLETPVMLLMGKSDFFTTVDEASAFFKEVPVKEKEIKFFDSGHILPNAYRVDAIRWITAYNGFR